MELAAEKQAGRRVALGLDGLAFNAWFHHFLASVRASDFLFLSLSLLICIMGSTTLPASSCEGAARCQCQAVSTEGEVGSWAGILRPGMGLSRNDAQKRQSRSGGGTLRLPAPRGPWSLRAKGPASIRGTGFGTQVIISILTQPLISCVTLGKSESVSSSVRWGQESRLPRIVLGVPDACVCFPHLGWRDGGVGGHPWLPLHLPGPLGPIPWSRLLPQSRSSKSSGQLHDHSTGTQTCQQPTQPTPIPHVNCQAFPPAVSNVQITIPPTLDL